MKSPAPLPDLWIDWCQVTSTPVADRDTSTIARFTQQVHPSSRVLAELQSRVVIDQGTSAPAWPAIHRSQDTALEQLVRRGSLIIDQPTTRWDVRIRLRRLLFTAVLIAPRQQGGLGLSRGRALRLTPGGLQDLRSRVGQSSDHASCPACAVWSWLQVIGVNNGWTHHSVRDLCRRRDHLWDTDQGHRHTRDDPSDDWLMCPSLLPAIDRWGYVEPYAGMHRSSLSVLVRAMTTLLDAPEPPAPTRDPQPINRPEPARRISLEEEKEIFTRANEVNDRIAKILAECR